MSMDLVLISCRCWFFDGRVLVDPSERELADAITGRMRMLHPMSISSSSVLGRLALPRLYTRHPKV